MIKDRLEEFRRKANISDDTSIDVEVNGDVTWEGSLCVDTNDLLELLDVIGRLYSDVKKLHEEIVQLRLQVDAHLNNKDKFEDQVTSVKKCAFEIRKGIQNLKEQYETNCDNLLSHIVRSHHLSLVVFSRDGLEQLSSLLVLANERHKDFIRKEMLITRGYDDDITVEEIESLLEKPDEVFTQDLLQETKLAKQVLAEIKERHAQVLELEKRIVELNVMFQDLAVLVRSHGETIDLIEHHMFVAEERTAVAREQMVQARENMQKARKKRYIIYVIISSLLIFLIVYLAIAFS